MHRQIAGALTEIEFVALLFGVCMYSMLSALPQFLQTPASEGYGFGASVIELIPRLVVGGVLVFLGLAFIVEWVWDKRKVLPRVEYVIVLLILGGIIAKGFLPGVVLGLVLAVVLFAVGRGDVVLAVLLELEGEEVAGIEPLEVERELGAVGGGLEHHLGERVAVLRLNGFVFFGSASALIERIRKRVEASPLRFLVMDLRREFATRRRRLVPG